MKDEKKGTRYFRAKILENNPVNKDFRLLIIEPIDDAFSSIPQAGQFYMLQCSNTYDPLLKRPFSIFRFDGRLHFLYKIKGKGTSLLASLRQGDIINAIGPLGKGYPEPEGEFIAVSGGIGIASLMPLIERFNKRAYLFYGSKTKGELLAIEDAMAFSKELFLCTEDGSEGMKGRVTDFLEKFSLFKNGLLPIYACGPNPMLKELAKIVEGKNFKCFVSLEEYMACGVGACLGCVVKCKKGIGTEEWTYKRVCKEGPVFEISKVLW